MSYRIDLTPNASYTETVSVSQDDVGREIAVDLYLDGTAYTPTTGTTITMQGTKPSGLGYTITGTASGSTVTFLTTLEMTQEAGRFASEIVLTNGNTVIGTANFALYVEKNPHPENTIDGTGETMQNLTVRMDALEDDVAALESATDVPAGYVPTADGQDGWSWEAQSGGGLTDGIKQALLQIAQKVAYVDEDGQDYYDDLYDALYAVTAISVTPTSVTLQTISGTQQLTATTTPSGATVTWTSSNTAVATVSSSGLVTAVAYGSATITATAGQMSATCAVVVAQATCTGITATYTQSGTVYDSDTLDSLKTDLVVTASWSNGTTSTLADTDYTLSGTLATGTSTVTVSYGGQTDTFDVTVSPYYYPTTLTDSSDFVGFGSYDVSKNTLDPPYIANTNHTRVHAMGTDELGYPVTYGKTYRITAKEAYAFAAVLFNEDGLAELENTAAVTNSTSISWTTMTSNVGTFTPTLVNGKEPVRMWIIFKKDSAGSGTWTNLTDCVPIVIEETVTLKTYSLDSGLTKVNAGVIPSANFSTVNTDGEIVLAYADSARRRGFPTTAVGDRCMMSTTVSDPTTEQLSETDYYPIPIPTDAAGVTVSITPNTQMMSVIAYTYDDTDHFQSDQVLGQSRSGWTADAASLSFEAGAYQYLSVASKYNSAGTSYPTEPTALTITFFKWR